jgi:erythromycin esterase-like protein
MKTQAVSQVHELIAEAAISLEEMGSDFDELVDRVGNARYVLLGEATHRTHEFYKGRAEMTKRLIQKKGFTIVGWEADWPDALRINRFIQHRSADRTAVDSLGGFKRFRYGCGGIGMLSISWSGSASTTAP